MLNQDILNNYEQLKTVCEKAVIKFPATVSFTIIHNLRKMQPIVEDIQATYDNLVLKYADRIDSNCFKVPEQNREAFNKEVNALYSIDTEIQISKIQFSDIKDLMISLQEMDALYFMIEET